MSNRAVGSQETGHAVQVQNWLEQLVNHKAHTV